MNKILHLGVDGMINGYTSPANLNGRKDYAVIERQADKKYAVKIEKWDRSIITKEFKTFKAALKFSGLAPFINCPFEQPGRTIFLETPYED